MSQIGRADASRTCPTTGTGVSFDGPRFIELYDDDGYRYIVNIDKISFVNVAGKKVWAGEVATLSISDESMDRLLSRLVGDGE